MAELVDIRRVEIGPENLVARVRIDDNGPLMTSEDLEGTTRVYRLLPHIVEHVCLGDAGETFRDAMGNTEIAHLLEHVTVELLAQTDLAGDMPAGRTWVDEVDDRTYEIELACPDDVLVSAALSCAAWICDWAYFDGSEPAPDVKAIVAGLVNLLENVGEGEDLVVDYDYEVIEPEPEPFEGGPLPWEIDTETEEESEPEEAEATEEPAPESDSAPSAPEPLWTPAPNVPHSATLSHHREPEVRVPEVEAEIDQIMATFERPDEGAKAEPEPEPADSPAEMAQDAPEDAPAEAPDPEPVDEPEPESAPVDAEELEE